MGGTGDGCIVGEEDNEQVVGEEADKQVNANNECKNKSRCPYNTEAYLPVTQVKYGTPL